jgi:hypothetical protein
MQSVHVESQSTSWRPRSQGQGRAIFASLRLCGSSFPDTDVTTMLSARAVALTPHPATHPAINLHCRPSTKPPLPAATPAVLASDLAEQQPSAVSLTLL